MRNEQMIKECLFIGGLWKPKRQMVKELGPYDLMHNGNVLMREHSLKLSYDSTRQVIINK